MRAFLLLAGVVLSACQDRPDTYIVPLAELDAEVRLGDDDRFSSYGSMIRLVADHDPCLVLSPEQTRVSVNGTPGEYDPGEPRHRLDDCYGPAAIFDSLPNGSPLAYEISDDSATWTFVMWDAFTYPRFTITSPVPAVKGEPVVLDLDISSGSIKTATVRGTAADSPAMELFEFDETNGVTITGYSISFVLPATVSASMIDLNVYATRDIRIDRCDAPRGCRPDAGNPAVSYLDLAIAP